MYPIGSRIVRGIWLLTEFPDKLTEVEVVNYKEEQVAVAAAVDVAVHVDGCTSAMVRGSRCALDDFVELWGSVEGIDCQRSADEGAAWLEDSLGECCHVLKVFWRWLVAYAVALGCF